MQTTTPPARPLDPALESRTHPPAPWERPALGALLVATAALYLWGLGSSGWANSFYSAAVQAGSESWKAFFFGSSDAANAITVDKTPLSLWPMALSVRIFGLSSWSILAPQALAGVATVALLHRTVRRTTGSAAAGLLAGLVLALTPVAVLMFRFNNPDALLVLLLTGAGVVTLRAIEETHRTDSPGRPVRWLVLGGTLVGLAFLTKMMQAFLVLPPLALVYLVCARTPVSRRLGHLLAAFAAMLVAGGWWVAVVELWPAASRPYIGGSQHNSILELTLGYNGLGRLSGNETGSVGGTGGPGGAGGPGWGATGIGRLFNGEIGGQVAWLVPAALLLGAVALWTARRDPRVRAALLLWTSTLVVAGLTFSFMAGIFHAYYTVALAPSIAALVGIGGQTSWAHRTSLPARVTLALGVAATAAWAFVLLGRSPDFLPWLRPTVLVLGLVGALGLIGVQQLPRRWSGAVVAVALTAALAGPAAYAVDTARTPHTGSIPTAGPATVVGGPGGRPGFPGGFPGGFDGARAGAMPGPGLPPGAPAPQGTAPVQPGQRPPTGTAGGSAGGPAGGLLSGSTSTTAITALLRSNSSSYTWVAAAIGSNTASGYQLASRLPVMAVGGFNGSDPSPSLAEFQAYVAEGRIHYFIGGGQRGGPGVASNGTSAQISAWVASTFTARTVDGVTLYDLSSGS